MEVALFLAADHANVEQNGKLNVLGIFDKIAARSFPLRHSMHLVLKLRSKPDERGGPYSLSVRLVDEDGTEVMRLTQDFEVPSPDSNGQPELNFILDLRELLFPQAGLYYFQVQVDQDVKAILPITLVES